MAVLRGFSGDGGQSRLVSYINLCFFWVFLFFYLQRLEDFDLIKDVLFTQRRKTRCGSYTYKSESYSGKSCFIDSRKSGRMYALSNCGFCYNKQERM